MPSTAPGSCATRILSGLDTKQRVGQLLMIGIPAADPLAGLSSLGAFPVGGVFLTGRSTRSADALAAALAQVQRTAARSAGVRLQVAVDQEGGFVQSLRGPDFPAIPSAVEQGEQSQSVLSKVTAQWAAGLVAAGITLDLAPVADTVPAGTSAENPPIGAQDRQYGSTPDAVADAVVTVVKAMLGANLGTTVKHFPGLGRVKVNTDTSAAAIDDRTTVEDETLQPFRAAIEANTSAVMISSALYPQLDPDHVAAFSKPIITGVLRTALHFDGLVISDDLGNAVAVRQVPAGQRAVDFVAAGGDMVLTVQPNDLAPMTDALLSRAARDAAFNGQVDAAALHVLQSKQSLGLLDCR